MHSDAAIDNRDEVSVGNEVQCGPRPGSVNATEENVTVKSSGESLWLHDGSVTCDDLGMFGGRRSPQ